MCWFTLIPANSKKVKRHSSDSSCAEDLVRVHHKSNPRFSNIKIKIPSSISMDRQNEHRQHNPHVRPHPHHHHLPHIHPLHLHPMHGPHHHHHHHHHEAPANKLRGPGRKRSASPPFSPDNTTCPSHSPSPSTALPTPREPVYRTQIIEPTTVRETTRGALRAMQSDRQQSRLRRVAGYEVLSRDVPWQWDCVSSTVGGSSVGGGKWIKRKSRRGLNYPPFGSIERWM
ncbi:predicted protein [Plenodomus lingam JN3]|uniref:Predicted protein n=1 Tax=Leptosphaeria maculans (strain JN3 / isolate v23.1.3 / race Av1-4-5-6-7-8) TaxID=985895 RepID=E5AF79_LEPMJ|nr:predicted protein [Plenodomus lingam JN3]CBY01868.1 predicted protein [Plenodomus lingam JN3]